MPLIYFIRHGQTDWNATNRIQGSVDTDINATGRSQADENGQRLKNLLGAEAAEFQFCASPMRRTRETMERIRAALGLELSDYATDPLLREICFGDWQGHRIEDIEANRPLDYAARLKDKWHYLPSGEGGETYQILSERAKLWLDKVRGKTVCVTHGGWMRTLLHRFGGMDCQEAANTIIPQDKILKLEQNRLQWL